MENIIHIARKGETLSAISKRYYKKSSLYTQIATYNGVPAPYTIHPGDVIEIPPKLWDVKSSSQSTSTAPTLTAKEVPTVPPPFTKGSVVVVGSYNADGSLVIDRTDKEVRITGTMEAYGDGATPTNMATAQATINRYWSQTFTDGYRVRCNVVIIAKPNKWPSSSNSKIEMNDHEGVAYVNALTGNMTLYLKDAAGNPTSDLTWAVAHEFGHVLGMSDKYSEGFFSKVMAIIGKDKYRTNKIEPGYSGNLMAQYSGSLESKNIADLDKENAPNFLNADDRIRLWVSRHSKSDLSKLNAATKISMINTLLNGFLGDADLAAIETICGSITTHDEGQLVDYELGHRVTEIQSFDQRLKVRIIFSKLP
jgi:hypothetical protein